ncbi:MAG: helix-turn-helix domain-containing protein [Pseudomonadota bacterium]
MEATIGLRLKTWRLELGLTQEKFAERLGMHIGVLKKYEQGVNTPGGEVLAAIARTGCNMTWLLTGEGKMLPSSPDAPADSRPNEPERQPRWRQIIELVEGIEEVQTRETFLQEIFSRARDKAEIAQLHRAVRELRAAYDKGH